MGRGKSVLIFEFISGGGIEESSDFEFLIPEGFGMLSSLITDFTQFGFLVHTFVDSRIHTQFQSTHHSLIKNNQLTYTKFAQERQISDELTMKIPEFDFILFIAPEFSNILTELVYKAEKVVKNHQTLLNFQSHAISIFSNKLKTESYLLSHGYCAPKSIELTNKLQNLEFSTLEYIIKPIDGVGAADTYCIHLNQETHSFNALISQISQISPNQQFIIQEKVPGIPLSAFISSIKGVVTYFVINSQTIDFTPLKQNENIQKIEYMGGHTPFLEISPTVMESIRTIASTICSQFHLTGFMGIDFLFDDASNSHSIVDINPRVTTPYIAISELFRDNQHNILECLFRGKFTQTINGEKHFKKDKNNSIALE